MAFYTHIGLSTISRAEDINDNPIYDNNNEILYYKRPGALFIHNDAVEYGNLGERPTWISKDPEYSGKSVFNPLNNITLEHVIDKYHFLIVKNTQVRLFGCNATFEKNGLNRSIARQFSEYFRGSNVDIYAFQNKSGTMMTNNRKIGHGEVNATVSERTKRATDSKDIWFAAYAGNPDFGKY